MRARAAAIVALALLATPAAAAPERTPYEVDGKAAAAYLDAMHRKIHPLYANKELPALDKFPPTEPFNDREAYAVLFIILDGAGKIVDVNMVKGTGVPELNQAIRRAINGAGPFPAPPDALKSDDGKTRIRWQFHRDPKRECQPTHAWPMLVVPG